jgi:putative MATE family efflux protein
MRQDFTQGNILKLILKTSYPMVIAFTLNLAYHLVDAMYVGWIGVEALAAVSFSFPVLFLMFALSAGIGTGSTSLIARCIGAKKFHKANNAAEHAILIAIIMGILFTMLGLIFAKDIFSIMGAGPDVMPLILDYVNVIFAGAILFFITVTINQILRGEGDMKNPMKIMLMITLINIILDPIFIFALNMGVKGAALATVISMGIGCIFALTKLFRKDATLQLNLREFHYSPSILKEIFKVGIPTSLSEVTMSVSMFMMNIIVAGFGTNAMAAFGIGFRLDTVAVMPAIGVMTAVISMTGQNIGARLFDRVKKIALIASALTASYMSVIGILFFLFSKYFVIVFNKTPEVVANGISYLKIIPLGYPFAGVGIVIAGILLGAGKSIQSLSLNVLRTIIISVPAAYFLSLKYGLNGVWMGIVIASVVANIVAVIWYKNINWENTKPIED